MEIGSEFNIDLAELNPTENTIFKYLSDFNTIYLNSGRDAIKLLFSFLKPEEIMLPNYICSSVTDNFENYNKKIYNINEDFSIDIEDLKSKISNETKYLYIMSYFGATFNDDVICYLTYLKSEKNIVIIEDTTHSIFSSRMQIGDYCICSLRKWFPTPDGGVLYSKNNLPKDDLFVNNVQFYSKKAYAMILKTLFLQNILDCNELYRNMFVSTDDSLNTSKGIFSISEFSKFILSSCDIDKLIKVRRKNYLYLRENILIDLDFIINFKATDCPYVLPCYVKNRDVFRKYLIENKIYCAVHWPDFSSNYIVQSKKTEDIYNNIISLPIDQRYGEKEMQYMVNHINNYKVSFIC